MLPLASNAVIEVRGGERPAAYKLVLGFICECPHCRPCLACNASGGGCLFDLISDPHETTDLAQRLPARRRALHTMTRAARRYSATV